jgi:regulator of sigma E protease
MDSFFYAVVFFVVALGLLIAIHEYGHFWVARKLGIKVQRFSIGFGKPLWTKVSGEDQTEFVLAAIPLGGYVKMLDERIEEVAPEEQHRAFNRQPLSTRFAVVAAGPIANFLFAILAYWLIFVMGIPGMKPLVGDVVADSVFAQAGAQRGDLILSLDDKEMPTLESVRMTLIEGVINQREMSLLVEGEDQVSRQLQLDLSAISVDSIDERFMSHLGFNPLRPDIPARISRVIDGGAAAQAGMLPGDEVIELDGQLIGDWEAWAAYVRARPAKQIEVIVLRDGEQHSLMVTPALIETEAGNMGRVGAAPDIPEGLFDDYRAIQHYSMLAAIPAALVKTWDMSLMTLQMLWKMLVGEASIENISGPLSIANYAGQTAQIGLVAFISFMAIVSVSLGVLNLLPVPILDGGHLMYYVVEFIKGSPVSEEAQLVGQKIGIALLGTLMFFALYNDINRLFS